MKMTSINYWHEGERYNVTLTGYALRLIGDRERSQRITEALRLFLGTDDHMAAAQDFCAHPDNAGMNLSRLIEVAVSRAYDVR